MFFTISSEIVARIDKLLNIYICNRNRFNTSTYFGNRLHALTNYLLLE